MANSSDDPAAAEAGLHPRSAELFERARAIMPRGNTRHSVFFPPHPVYCASASGCRVTDVDGVERIDFVNNFSSLVHGHGHRAVGAAIMSQLERVIAVGLPTEAEIVLAELLCDRISGVAQVRFANSGTEAVMMAIRAARAHTGRRLIAKFEGCYHGTYDPAEVSQAPHPPEWGPPSSPASVPLSRGTPPGICADVLVLPFNDPHAARRLLEQHASEIAGVLVDLAPAHLGYLTMSPEMLGVLRDHCDANGSLLIIDEVYSLRFNFHGAQALFNVRSDMTIMGKIIGGGLPVGAVGASAEIMSVFDPLPGGPRVVHGGTYNANPLTMAAGIASMEALGHAEIETMARLGARLRAELKEIADECNVETVVGGLESVASITFGKGPLSNYRDRERLPDHHRRVLRFHRAMLDEGILVAPQGLVVLSTAMTDREIDDFLAAGRRAFRRIA